MITVTNAIRPAAYIPDLQYEERNIIDPWSETINTLRWLAHFLIHRLLQYLRFIMVAPRGWRVPTAKCQGPSTSIKIYRSGFTRSCHSEVQEYNHHFQGHATHVKCKNSRYTNLPKLQELNRFISEKLLSKKSFFHFLTMSEEILSVKISLVCKLILTKPDTIGTARSFTAISTVYPVWGSICRR